MAQRWKIRGITRYVYVSADTEEEAKRKALDFIFHELCGSDYELEAEKTDIEI